jgi:hypothetical protein
VLSVDATYSNVKVLKMSIEEKKEEPIEEEPREGEEREGPTEEISIV